MPPSRSTRLCLAGIPTYLRAQGFRAGAHLVSARMVPADAATAEALRIPAGALVHDVIRVRLADEVRISLEHARFPAPAPRTCRASGWTTASTS